MVPDDYLLSPERIDLEWADWEKPVAIVDLATWPIERVLPALPPFPVIGFGNREHPIAASLDTLVEQPASVAGLLSQISAHPHAAAVAVQLLRAIEAMAIAPALLLESLAYGVLQGSTDHAKWLAGRPTTVAPPAPGVVRIERRDTTLDALIDRPHARNAIDRAIRDGLFEAFTIACLDPEIERVSLRSRGPAFSIGADLAEFGTTRDPATAHLIRRQTLPANALVGCLDKFEAHVHGACIGAGIELAAFARRLTATSGAWFQLPELAMGLTPGAGGCVSLSRRIGRQRAALMILSGRRVSARIALQWGLIDAIEDDPARDDRGADEIGGKD